MVFDRMIFGEVSDPQNSEWPEREEKYKTQSCRIWDILVKYIKAL